MVNRVSAAVLVIILLSWCVQGCHRPGGQGKPNKRAAAVLSLARSSSSQSDRQAKLPEPKDVDDTRTLAALLRPRLPKGWTLSASEDRVAIERVEPIEVYNGVGLPAFLSEAERRDYVRPEGRREKFVISLHLGERVDQETRQLMVQRNDIAEEKARRDMNNFKLMPDAKFWREHPEYGHQEVPTFYTGRHSIYMECDLDGRWVFWSAQVGAECQGVINDLSKLLRPYAPGQVPAGPAIY